MSDQNQTSAIAQRIEGRIDKTVAGQTGLTLTGGMNFNSVEQIMEFAKIMAIAGVAIPKHLREQAGACLAVAIQACEWQMSPFAVANKSYVVNDRIGYEAQLVNAVILRRAPIKGRFKISYSGTGATRKCKVTAALTGVDDGETVEYESPAFSEITTKNSPLWKADPDQQLFYYSSRAMCRRHFPDVILGVYTADELADGAMEMQATVREIPRASLPNIPKETPAATSTPVATEPAPAEPKAEAPKKEPKPKPEKPAEKKPEPPAATSAPADTLLARLEAEGLTADDGVAFAKSFWPALGHITTLAEIPAARIADLMDDWNETMKEIRKLKGDK